MLEAWKKNSGMRELSAFMEDDSGVGVIEVVLILWWEYLPPNSRYILCRYSGNSGNRETV